MYPSLTAHPQAALSIQISVKYLRCVCDQQPDNMDIQELYVQIVLGCSELHLKVPVLC